jgi:hypothetical protein
VFGLTFVCGDGVVVVAYIGVYSYNCSYKTMRLVNNVCVGVLVCVLVCVYACVYALCTLLVAL